MRGRHPLSLHPPFPGEDDAFLALEALAAEPYDRFVYGPCPLADSVRRLLYDKRLGEWVPPHGRLAATPEGRVVGLLAALPALEVPRRRLAAVRAMAAAGFLVDRRVVARLRSAAGALAVLQPGDYYLSRLAVAAAARGTGVGKELLTCLSTQARRCGFGRIVLEVSGTNEGARALYAACGFTQFGLGAATDPETESHIELLHLAHVLSG